MLQKLLQKIRWGVARATTHDAGPPWNTSPLRGELDAAGFVRVTNGVPTKPNEVSVGTFQSLAQGVGMTTAAVLADTGPHADGESTYLTDGPDIGAPLRWYAAGPWWGWAMYPSSKYGS